MYLALAVFAIAAIPAIVYGSFACGAISLAASLIAIISAIAVKRLGIHAPESLGWNLKGMTPNDLPPNFIYDPSENRLTAPKKLSIPETLHWLKKGAELTANNPKFTLRFSDLTLEATDTNNVIVPSTSVTPAFAFALTVIVELLKEEKYKNPDTRDTRELNNLLEPLTITFTLTEDAWTDSKSIPSFEFLDGYTLNVPLLYELDTKTLTAIIELCRLYKPEPPCPSLNLHLEPGTRTEREVMEFPIGTS